MDKKTRNVLITSIVALVLILAGDTITEYYVNDSYGVRPAIALTKGTRISGGVGTQANPFVVN